MVNNRYVAAHFSLYLEKRAETWPDFSLPSWRHFCVVLDDRALIRFFGRQEEDAFPRRFIRLRDRIISPVFITFIGSSRCLMTACYFRTERQKDTPVWNNFENDIPIAKLFTRIIGVNYFSQVTPAFCPRNTHANIFVLSLSASLKWELPTLCINIHPFYKFSSNSSICSFATRASDT